MIKKELYYNFDNKKVKEKFEGDLTFVNEFCVLDEYYPVAVYKVSKPNYKKGHKKYLLLTNKYVRGMSTNEIKKWRYQAGIKCLECEDILYSTFRHHQHYCSCKKSYVDGGRDYVHASGPCEVVTIDLLKDAMVKTA